VGGIDILLVNSTTLEHVGWEVTALWAVCFPATVRTVPRRLSFESAYLLAAEGRTSELQRSRSGTDVVAHDFLFLH
jgi:hypothetical protein